MAAKRNGIKTVIIPRENQRDLAEIDPVVRENLRFVVAETVDTILAEALCQEAVQPVHEEMAVSAFIPAESPVRDAGLRQ